MTLDAIIKVTCAEDLFGTDPKQVRKKFVELAKLAHPDGFNEKNGNLAQKATAETAFKVINDYYDYSEILIAKGDYGKRLPLRGAVAVTIISKKTTYNVFDKVYSGEYADLFTVVYEKDGTAKESEIKLPCDIADNDLIVAEQNTLNAIKVFDGTGKLYDGFFPKIEDTLDVKFKGNRKATVFEKLKGCYTLQEVMDKFPEGLNLRHAAWMWRRLLGALTLTHSAGYVHGAVLPNNFLIFPESHRGVLRDFTASVKIGEKLKIISSANQDYYPAEVKYKDSDGKRPYLTMHPKHDIYMAAKCMERLVAGKTGSTAGYSKKFEALLRACLLEGYARLDNVAKVHEDFGVILKEIFGPSKFIEFKMPA